MNRFVPSEQGGTYGGNPLVAAVGLAVVEEVCSGHLLTGVRRRAQQLTDRPPSSSAYTHTRLWLAGLTQAGA